MQMDSVKILSRKRQIPFTILCYNKMYDTYVIEENDTINRRRIRDIIFHNEALRKLFQEIVFGFVEREVDDLLLNYKER